MTNDELKKALFRAKAAELPGLVSTLCVLAANFDTPEFGFNIIDNVLKFCRQEFADFEARVMVTEAGDSSTQDRDADIDTDFDFGSDDDDENFGDN